jgi:hypothetical protein
VTGCEKVLARLRQGPASHSELYGLNVIAHSRIAELRKKGHRIECARGTDGLYHYSLLEEGEPNEPDGALAVDDGVEPSPVPQAVASEPASPSSSGDARPDTNKGVSVVSSLPYEAAPEIDPGQLSILDLVA